MRSLFTSILFALSFAFGTTAPAQTDIPLLSKWDFRRGASLHEKINKVIGTSNGLIVAVGETISPNLQDVDGLFLVIDPEEGKEFRRKTFGGAGNNSFSSVVQNHDGTLTLVGYTMAGRKSDQDGWIVQLDIEGNLVFEDKPAGTGQRDDQIRRQLSGQQ